MVHGWSATVAVVAGGVVSTASIIIPQRFSIAAGVSDPIFYTACLQWLSQNNWQKYMTSYTKQTPYELTSY